MRIIISVFCLVLMVIAEPPVGDGYPSARSGHDEHHHDHLASEHQRSLSQEYGPPSDTFESTRNAPSDGYEYNGPNARASSNARGRSQFPPPSVRVSFNQRFSSASIRNSGKSATRSGPEEHANVRGISHDSTSKSPSQNYGAPSIVSARTLSTEYGMPDARSTPSEEYGVPAVTARNGATKSAPSDEYGVPVIAARRNQSRLSTNFRSTQPSASNGYPSPAARSQPNSTSHGYSAPSGRSNEASQRRSSSLARSNDVSEAFNNTPEPVFGARNAPSSTYGSPVTQSHSQSSHDGSSTRRLESQNMDSISQTYGTPDQRKVSDTYGVPNARSQSDESHERGNELPSSITNLMTSAVASSFASVSSRSSPSSSYLPASRASPPSEQYGIPEQEDGVSQGYNYADRARALEEELQNQEPASYDFGYQIEDQESGSDFGHSETREANKVQGSYFVVRPDGSKQTVEYEADERGFKPRISVEPADAAARSGGYDDNAQDLGRADDEHSGPY